VRLKKKALRATPIYSIRDSNVLKNKNPTGAELRGIFKVMIPIDHKKNKDEPNRPKERGIITNQRFLGVHRSLCSL